MKKTIVLSCLILFTLLGCKENSATDSNGAAATQHDETASPLDVVNKRMELYNQHDIEAFIKLYDENVKIYNYPNKQLNKGADNIASIFEPMFAEKSVSVEVVNQIDNGNYVINHEIVTENGTDTKYVSIYEVQNGLIKSVRFVRDN